ncbi:MAG: LytTR family DNA-binding domain-containing protein [Blastocatellia bacterium]
MTEPKRLLIVDDEALARQRVRRYVEQFAEPFLIAEAASGLEAVAQIHALQPHIVFLDIEMPGLTGLEVLQQFEQRAFLVIFQTAFDEFAVRAFEENACDYLLKPFNAARLHKALAQALARVADEERFRTLEAQLAARTGFLQRLTVKQGSRMRLVETHDIHCFVSQDHYTCVYFGAQQEGIVDLSLARLHERLDPHSFRQLHRNNLVRVGAIVALSITRQGEMLIELTNGMKLPVSRVHRQEARLLLRT